MKNIENLLTLWKNVLNYGTRLAPDDKLELLASIEEIVDENSNNADRLACRLVGLYNGNHHTNKNLFCLRHNDMTSYNNKEDIEILLECYKSLSILLDDTYSIEDKLKCGSFLMAKRVEDIDDDKEEIIKSTILQCIKDNKSIDNELSDVEVINYKKDIFRTINVEDILNS